MISTEKLAAAVLRPVRLALARVLPLARSRPELAVAVITLVLRVAVRRAARLAVAGLSIDLARGRPFEGVPALPVWEPGEDLDERLGKAVQTVVDDLAAALDAEESPEQFEDPLEPDDEPQPDDEPPDEAEAEFERQQQANRATADRASADLEARRVAERAAADLASAGRARARAEEFEERLARYAAEDRAADAERRARDRIERLAISELTRAADAAAVAALADDPSLVAGWVRVLNEGACPLCQAWARDQAVRPPERTMKRHPGCVCSQVWISDVKEARDIGYANRSEQVDDTYRDKRAEQRRNAARRAA